MLSYLKRLKKAGMKMVAKKTRAVVLQLKQGNDGSAYRNNNSS